MLLVLELVGIAVFAASGALAGVRARLDVFGVVILAMTTALGGGIIRDVLLDVSPPASLRDWRYLLVTAVTGLVVFWVHPHMAKLRRAMLLADAVGLGLFTTAGTITALELGAPAYTACLIGMTTGIGGGALRDLLIREIPVVLQREIYAVAALLGAIVVVLGRHIGLPQGPTVLAGAALIVTIRVLGLWRKWNAPLPREL
ncbi:trimeric intracellular cation channel family protein [Allokutzneria sp. A3M-2-11 16]|uniref:trimeric intracellular cation channel family protein n=1 Tax=Allokutzneria sp. A3M-2-11 16 TaxID=2962043 RepID=UPI0020B733B5|nr:trimeric intracellular cation channel family protein [Allokutzneria sp. A3M-2-11 16]MCP3800266.1 trimeric intracellular cation channel family protein [Allokutzneria sp. A3M-2-11 16]